MAKRPVFIPQLTSESLVREEEIEFVFFNGFAVSQKQKSINSLHEAALRALELSGEILEVSTKSMQKVGTELSAFNLTIDRTAISIDTISVIACFISFDLHIPTRLTDIWSVF